MRNASLALVALLAAAPLCARAAEAPSAVSAIETPPATEAPSPVPPAEPALETPPAPSASRVLRYVPNNAAGAVFIRFDRLRETKLWKTFADPDVGLFQEFAAGLPLAADLEKDVASAALIIEVAAEDGRPQSLRTGWAIEWTRDRRPADVLRDPGDGQPVPGLSVPAYPAESDRLAAFPDARVLVLADRDLLVRMVAASQTPGERPAGPLPVEALTAAGEVTLAAQAPAAVKDAIREEYDGFRREMLRPGMGGEPLMDFALQYNLVRMALQAERLTGSLDLGREADAFRLEIGFAGKGMAPFMADLFQALADPLQMGLPAVLGGRPLDEPPAQPFYRAVADGSAARLTMSRESLYQFVSDLAVGVRETRRLTTGQEASARNLRTLGVAILAYATTTGEFPRIWADLKKANLIFDDNVFLNPALAVHMPAGDYELVPLTKRLAEREGWRKVLAYEAYPPDGQPTRLNVLFANGDVQCLEMAKFRRLYQQTLESLGR